MTPSEKIAAAIARLEQLKADSTSGPWEQGFAYDGIWRSRECDTVGQILRSDGEKFSPVTDGRPSQYVDAHLIVTLHRTLDAQLAILRNSAAFRIGGDYTHELALADAILGEPT